MKINWIGVVVGGAYAIISVFLVIAALAIVWAAVSQGIDLSKLPQSTEWWIYLFYPGFIILSLTKNIYITIGIFAVIGHFLFNAIGIGK